MLCVRQRFVRSYFKRGNPIFFRFRPNSASPPAVNNSATDEGSGTAVILLGAAAAENEKLSIARPCLEPDPLASFCHRNQRYSPCFQSNPANVPAMLDVRFAESFPSSGPPGNENPGLVNPKLVTLV